jgi:hypothetical protein
MQKPSSLSKLLEWGPASLASWWCGSAWEDVPVMEVDAASTADVGLRHNWLLHMFSQICQLVLLQSGVNLLNIDLTAVTGATAYSWCPQSSLPSQRKPGTFPQCEENQLDVLPKQHLDNAAEEWLSTRQESNQSQLDAGWSKPHSRTEALRICQLLLAILMGCLPRSLLFLHNTTLFKATCSACYLFHVGFLLGLLFNPEDGGDMYLRNVNWLSVD